MAKNSRQRRTAKIKAAFQAEARIADTVTVARQGNVRSAWGKVMPPRAHVPFHGRPEPEHRPTKKRWSVDGFKSKD
jgi:hypothetical protein